MSEFSHVDQNGRLRMVDVTSKASTQRKAKAKGWVKISPVALEQIQENSVRKGNVLETARLAGILAAKNSSQLIPLCHSLSLTHVDIECIVMDEGIEIEALASAEGKTGVEMEALIAVSVAALTIYDMCKAIDRFMEITDIKLMEKSGGRSGSFRRPSD